MLKRNRTSASDEYRGEAASPEDSRLAKPTDLRLWATVYVLSAGFLVGMEWLFFATKPSFLNAFTFPAQLRVFGAALMPLLAVGLGLVAVFSAAARLRPFMMRLLFRALMRALPTVILTTSGLLLVDNFTTTVFAWGIASLRGARLLYAAAVLVGMLLVWRQVGRWAISLRSDRRVRTVAEGLAAGLVAIAVVGAALERMSATPALQSPDRPARRPNILLIGMDGVNADHLSIYGYERPTTPTLAELSRGALIFTNAYTNAGSTGAALTAMLTGRLPTDTRVLFAPDTLRGDAAMLHLPALLRAMGYRTAQFAVRHYAASIDFNLRAGFDVVNDQEFDDVASRALEASGFRGYFLTQIAERVRSRVSRLAGYRDPSAFAQVTSAPAAEYMDGSRLRELQQFLAQSREPWFAHIHLLLTHGGRFGPPTRHFSAGKAEADQWMPDFYDDAILTEDGWIGELLQLIRRQGAMDRTLIVVYADHGQRFRTEHPLPLIVRLPGGSRRGRVGEAVQLIDIAPTILDTLGLRHPEWMAGQSLLGRVPPCRPVFAGIATRRIQVGDRDYTIPAPPFYSLGAVSLVHGQQWFLLDLNAPEHLSSAVVPLLPGAAARCEPLSAPTARAAILDHLRARGYDVSSVE